MDESISITKNRTHITYSLEMPTPYSFYSLKSKKVLYGKLRGGDVREIISTLCRYKNVEILEGAFWRDYVHHSVAILPKLSNSSVMRYLEGKSIL